MIRFFQSSQPMSVPVLVVPMPLLAHVEEAANVMAG